MSKISKTHQKEQSWREAILPHNATIGQAILNLNKTSIKIVLVATKAGVIEGTLSDGDIRRGILKGLNLNSSITSIIRRNALVVPQEMKRELVMQLMLANGIQQIPIVDDQHHIVGLHLWDEITVPTTRSNIMVIMAGGMGTRLLPYTETCPKPLLPVAGKPMFEHIIERAKLEEFNHFVLAIHCLGHMIEEHLATAAILVCKYITHGKNLLWVLPEH